MDVRRLDPPRTFDAGSGVRLRHCADMALEPEEQVTFVTASGTEFDVVRKAWGYYATPSMNARLRSHGLRAALVVGAQGDLFLHLVERGKEPDFEAYLERERAAVVTWLDTDERAAGAVERLRPASEGGSE